MIPEKNLRVMLQQHKGYNVITKMKQVDEKLKHGLPIELRIALVEVGVEEDADINPEEQGHILR